MKKIIGIVAMLLAQVGVGKSLIAQPIRQEQLRWMDMVRETREDTVPFQYLQLSGEVSIQLGGGNQSAQVVVRMKNDSCIWATVRVMGIEGVRAMITRDSVWVMDRLKKTYSVQPLSVFTQKLGVEVGLKTLQQQFLGKLSDIPSFLSYQDSKDLGGGMNSYRGGFSLTKGDSSPKSIVLIRNEKNCWQSLEVEQDSSIFSLNYRSYVVQAEGNFPRTMEARKSNLEDPLFQLTLSKIEFKNFETFPFKIPESYLRIDER